MLCALLWSGSVRSQEPTPEADPFETLAPEQVERVLALLEAAGRAEANGDWEDALAAYAELEAIVPAEEYRYRTAVCLEQLGRLEEALALQRELANSRRPDIQAAAGQRLAVLESLWASRPARLHVSPQPPGATVRVGAQEPGPSTDGTAVFELPPGDHTIDVRLDGYAPHAEVLTLSAGEERTLAVVLEPVAPPIALEAARPGNPDRTLPIALGGGAALSAGVAVVLGVMARSRAAEERQYDRSAVGANRAAVTALGDEAEALATAANVTWAVAGGLALATVIVLLTGDAEVGDAPPTSAGPALELGNGAALSITF